MTGESSSADGLTDAQRSLRAQLLATEHWSLLASRSTTQSEVLTRIAIFLTLVSAGLVTLGFIGQASGFRGWFGVAALGVLLALALLGLITMVRAFNTADEDLMYVVAMNRLRAAYLDLDPGLERYLYASANDDETGVRTTYHFFYERGASAVFGSSMMIITVVEAIVVGLLAGSTAAALGASPIAAIVLGAAVAVIVVVLAILWGRRIYRRAIASLRPIRPSR
ncbi:hypothetical protein [Leifsonia sp. fls2-241-R2A-40a]|uniref:hypothetical protein n=1 Tax=Leifsonia sp. fls2-241-R2A-40a TaxID=3040290 RepID=UPI0025519F18|nr:hypothetical protein [Leifsonia sp. fls2-241-R2A-40a]